MSNTLVISANPPTAQATGNGPQSGTSYLATRVQPMDGAGNDASASHPAPVYTPSGTSNDVNLTKVGGAAVALGQSVMAVAIPVVLPSDQTPVPVKVDQTTPGTTNRVQAGGTTPRVTAQYVRAAAAGPYVAGQNIGNSTTAASVVPITISNAARVSGGSGRISGVRCVVTAASGTIVLPSFNLYIFRPATNIPFAAGSYPADNATFNLSSAAMVELVGVLQFSVGNWLNQAGLNTAAGASIYQAASFTSRAYAPYNLASIPSADLLAMMQVQNGWAPGAVQQTFDFAFDIDQD